MRLFLIPAVFFAFISCNEEKEEISFSSTAPFSCSFSRDEKDPMGKRILVVDEERVLSKPFSDSATKEYFRGNDFVKGYISCFKVDTVKGIYFNCKIFSSAADKLYGGIVRNNKIVFTLESHDKVELYFGTSFTGNTNLSEDFTEYYSFARLSQTDAKKLMSEIVKKVRIYWKKTTEDYEIENPRIFINQLPCLQ